MKQIIGIIGSTGDLGSQLTARIKKHGYDVREHSRSIDNGITVPDIIMQSDIVHVCAPLSVLSAVPSSNTIIILHDSVMDASQQASARYLGGGAAIVHMLMNHDNAVIVATDAPHHETVSGHLADIGLHPHAMTIGQHDYMIARSQAPLALLCKTLLPYLYEQSDKGMLTPSGQLLADTLRSRELIWTDETMRSILRNPQLQTLINDMQSVIMQNKGE